MTISLFAKPLRIALSPRLGAILALSAFLSLGIGPRDARALLAVKTYADFGFSFDAVFSVPLWGSIFAKGSGVLNAERTYSDPAGQWLIDGVTNGVLLVGSSGGKALLATLAYAPPNTYPTTNGNDNLVFPGASPPHQLDSYGITFAVEDGSTILGFLNITDPPQTYTFNAISEINGGGSASGSGTFQAAPGPTPGTGLLAFAFLMLAGAATRARGLLAR